MRARAFQILSRRRRARERRTGSTLPDTHTTNSPSLVLRLSLVRQLTKRVNWAHSVPDYEGSAGQLAIPTPPPSTSEPACKNRVSPARESD